MYKNGDKKYSRRVKTRRIAPEGAEGSGIVVWLCYRYIASSGARQRNSVQFSVKK
jgi:hypothetical protein